MQAVVVYNNCLHVKERRFHMNNSCTKNFYIEKVIKVKMREEDQFFEIGDYNVGFYWDEYLGKNGNEFYAIGLDKFDGDKLIAHKWLYVRKVNDETYPTVWARLHKETLLNELINRADNSVVTI
jgi:hypothetical protein